MEPQTIQLLQKLEKTSKKYWNIHPSVGQFLYLLILDRKFKNVLEIGTSNGYSGIWLASALAQTNGHLYTIESHKKQRYQLALENFAKAGLTQNITPILGHAPEDLPQKPAKFDLAFFDATKYEHLSYLRALESRIKKGGIIITDNYHSHTKDLTPYLNHIKKLPNWHTEILSLGTGLIISSKTA